MDEFFKTQMGRKFFEGIVPKISNALIDLASELKRSNDLKEIELKLLTKEKVK